MIMAGPQQKPGAPYCGQTSGGSNPDIAATWEETYFPDEFRTYITPGATNALFGTLPQITNVYFNLAKFGAFFWVQSHIPVLFTGNVIGIGISFFQSGDTPNPTTFTFQFGARGFNSGVIIDQGVGLTNVNATVTPTPMVDKIWYCSIPNLTLQGDLTPGNFVYIKVGRYYPENLYLTAITSLAVSYPLSGFYSL